MQSSSPYLETKTAQETCMFLEKKAGEVFEAADYDSSMLREGGQYLCMHTGRVSGPDYRPADAKTCKHSRSCFHARGL
jgi:hypothetical protein